jgi:hypothetical protein
MCVWVFCPHFNYAPRCAFRLKKEDAQSLPFGRFKPEGTYNASWLVSLFSAMFSVPSAGFTSPLSGFDRLGLFADIRHYLLSTVGFAVIARYRRGDSGSLVR